MFRVISVSEKTEDTILASAADARSDGSWKRQMGGWYICELADGNCNGGGYGYRVHEDAGNKGGFGAFR